jgi:hypothetical protein
MPYVSAKQRANEAVESGFVKLGLILLALLILRLFFVLSGRMLAQWLYPKSETAQKTVRKMWRNLGLCIMIWVALRIVYS